MNSIPLNIIKTIYVKMDSKIVEPEVMFDDGKLPPIKASNK